MVNAAKPREVQSVYTEDRRYLCYMGIALLVLFSPEVSGQVTTTKDIMDSTTTQEFGFWYRTIVASLLAVLVWIARGADSRLRGVENAIKDFGTLAVERGGRLKDTEDRLRLLEMEHKNTVSLILAQRELLLTKYHDKEDTERHRDKLERALEEQSKSLAHISARLDLFARPHHRGSDDEHGHRD